jgi:large subunit ribosomal protein L25
MEKRSFTVEKRTELGKGAVGRLRRSGKIPAVIYGRTQKNNVSVSINEKEYLREHGNLTESTLVILKLDGKEHTVFVKDAQEAIVSGKVLHVDFYEVEKGQNVRTHVLLHLVGIPSGVRAGGVLENPTHMIEVECDPSVLPEKLDVDVSALEPNQSVHVKDLNIDPQIRVISSADTVVALVKYAKDEPVPVVAAAVADAATVAKPGEAAAPTPGAAPAAKAEAKPKA